MQHRIEGTIFHWSATGPRCGVADLRAIHKGKGWRDIGYHRVILHPDYYSQDAQPEHWWELVKEGRTLDTDLYIEDQEVGAHTLGYNARMLGVCVIGRPGMDLHPLQREAIIQVAHLFAQRHQYPIVKTFGHRDFNATMCPGPEIYALIKAIKKGLLQPVQTKTSEAKPVPVSLPNLNKPAPTPAKANPLLDALEATLVKALEIVRQMKAQS